MFADFEDEVYVNEHLIEESEEWLADILTEEDISHLEEKVKKGDIAYRDIEHEPEQLVAKGGGKVRKLKGQLGSAASRARHSRVGKAAGQAIHRGKEAGRQYMRGLKGAPGVSAQRKWATRGATAAGVAAGAAGAAMLAKRMKKRKECRARFPNDPEKYKACVKS
jgi:hypothetical protein